MRRSIVWFTTDLRLHDNEVLLNAIAQSDEIIPVYCFNEESYQISEYGFKKTGKFRFKFICESLIDLDNSLRQRGSGLLVLKGNPEKVFFSYYFELYKHKIIKRLPDINNVLNISVFSQAITNTSSRTIYNDNYIALYYEATNTVDVYKLSDIGIIGARKTISGIKQQRNMDIDSRCNVTGVINGITYTNKNKATYLYITDKNNNIIIKIIYDTIEKTNIILDCNMTINSFLGSIKMKHNIDSSKLYGITNNSIINDIITNQ